MEHVSKDGLPKILHRCSLPLTGNKVVNRIITDRAVLDVTPRGLVLREVASGFSVEDIQNVTEPDLIVDEDLKENTF